MVDRESTLRRGRQNGRALAHAAEPLKPDRELVFEAVRQNGNALMCAAQPLTTDRELWFGLAFAALLLAMWLCGFCMGLRFRHLLDDKQAIGEHDVTDDKVIIVSATGKKYHTDSACSYVKQFFSNMHTLSLCKRCRTKQQSKDE